VGMMGQLLRGVEVSEAWDLQTGEWKRDEKVTVKLGTGTFREER